MTRRALAMLMLAALLGACGKYGAPLRASEVAQASVSGVTAGHPEDCQDPEHEHDGAQEAP